MVGKPVEPKCAAMHSIMHAYIYTPHTGSCLFTVHGIQLNLSIKDTLGPSSYVLITEVSSIQRSFYTLQYYTGTQNGVLNIEIFLI